MNRQERRRQKLDSKPKIYTLTDTQISQMKTDAVAQASSKAFIAMLGLPLVALRKFGFGKERLERFEEELLRQYRCFEQGYITLDELNQIIRDETGMEVSENK